MLFMHDPAEFLASLIAWFDSKEKATFVAALMLAALFAVAGRLYFKHWRFVGQIKAATGAVQAAMSETAMSAADRMNVIENALVPNEVVHGAWDHYRTTLRPDPKRSGSFVESPGSARIIHGRSPPGSRLRKMGIDMGRSVTDSRLVIHVCRSLRCAVQSG